MTAGHEAAIREAGGNALVWSFGVLAKERVLPRSRYQPWISVGQDYEGHAVEGASGALSRALKAGLPDRFEGEGDGPDTTWYYASAVLETAVAAATLAEEPYAIASPSVAAVIDRFIEGLQRLPSSTVMQLVADVDVEHEPVAENHQDRLGESVEIAGVRVIRVGVNPEKFMERELPSTGYSVEREDVFVHPEPASLLVSTTSAWSPYEDRMTEARVRVGRLITGLQLATGATAYSVMRVAGESALIRRGRPRITPLPSWGYRFVHRPVTIRPGDAAGLESVTRVVATLETSSLTAVRIALGRLGRSYSGQTTGLIDQVVDLAVGLEGALAGTEKTEVGLRLRNRAAALLAGEDDEADAIYRDVKTLYDLRSTFAHGGMKKDKDIGDAIASVATGVEWPGEQFLVAVDRWRDLLRRAILTRLALASAPESPWTRAPKFDIDERLLRARDRDAWRDHIQAFWSEKGLPSAARRASPPRRTF